jgi:hypothetical protein
MNETGVPVGLIDRVKNILLKPKEEWARIDGEPASVGGLYTSYIVPLAAITPVASLIGWQVFGYSVMGVTWKPSLVGSIASAVVQYVLALVGVFVVALIIDALAPSFNATKNRVQALKVAAYSATAGWVAGIFGLIPALSLLAVLCSLYGLYLLYLGLPRLMKAPEEKALAYTITTVVVAVVVSLVLGVIATPVAALFGGGAAAGLGAATASADGEAHGTVSVPGMGSVDLDKLNDATRQMEQASNGQAPSAVPASVLQALLPASVAGLARSSSESSSAAAGGVGGSRAEAEYGSGDSRLTLEITDMAAMGGLAALGSALNVESNRTTDTGYERVGTVDGRMTTEKWDSSSREGSYSVIIANRFMVEAEGNGVEMTALKAAVASINPAALENAARP